MKSRELSQDLRKSHFNFGNNQSSSVSQYKNDYTQKDINRSKLSGDSISLRKTNFVLGNYFPSYSTTAAEQNTRISTGKFQVAKLESKLKNDLRDSHFSFGNFPRSLLTNNQLDFNNKSGYDKNSSNLSFDPKTLRSHNHKLGYDNIEYISETQSRFSKPSNSKDLAYGKNISTAELQQCHYKFGNDTNNFQTTSQLSFTPKDVGVKLMTKDLTKTNFILGSESAPLQSSSSSSYVKHHVTQRSQENKELSNDLRNHHYTLGNNTDKKISISQQDFRSHSKEENRNTTISNALLRQSHIKLGDNSPITSITTYSESMKPYDDFKKQQQLENNNYKSSILNTKNANENTFSTESRVNYVSKPAVWTREEKDKVKNIVSEIKRHNCEYGIDKNNYETTSGNTYKYNYQSAMNGRGVLKDSLSKDLRDSHYSIGYGDSFEKVSTNQAAYQPLIHSVIQNKANDTNKKSNLHFETTKVNIPSKSTYTTDYSKKMIEG